VIHATPTSEAVLAHGKFGAVPDDNVADGHGRIQDFYRSAEIQQVVNSIDSTANLGKVVSLRFAHD
jgi:hypothetical protein